MLLDSLIPIGKNHSFLIAIEKKKKKKALFSSIDHAFFIKA
jgi:hypothetical protein